MKPKETLFNLRDNRNRYHPIDRLSAETLEDYVKGAIAASPKLEHVRRRIFSMSPDQLVGAFDNDSYDDDLFAFACGYLAMYRLEQLAPEANVGNGFLPYEGNEGKNASAYKIGPSFIAVVFGNDLSSYYLYTYQTTGVRGVEILKRFARAGECLNRTLHPKNFRNGDNCYRVVSHETLRITK